MSEPISSSAADLDLTQRLAEQLAVERVRQGDAFALEMIFTAYRHELLEAARRILGAPEAAEDVVQDVFLAIWARRERWRISTSLGAYLRRAVHNGAVRAGQSGARRAGIEIAERLGLSLSTVEIHMTRALAALRHRLAGWRG